MFISNLIYNKFFPGYYNLLTLDPRYEPSNDSYHYDIEGKGVMCSAVDILPTEFAKEVISASSDQLQLSTCLYIYEFMISVAMLFFHIIGIPTFRRYFVPLYGKLSFL